MLSCRMIRLVTLCSLALSRANLQPYIVEPLEHITHSQDFVCVVPAAWSVSSIPWNSLKKYCVCHLRTPSVPSLASGMIGTRHVLHEELPVQGKPSSQMLHLCFFRPLPTSTTTKCDSSLQPSSLNKNFMSAC